MFALPGFYAHIESYLLPYILSTAEFLQKIAKDQKFPGADHEPEQNQRFNSKQYDVFSFRFAFNTEKAL